MRLLLRSFLCPSGWWLAWGLILLLPGLTRAHVPVPESVLHPASAAEAWNVLRLATANTERLLREDRLSEIPDQLSLCSPALRALPPFVADPAQQKTVTAGTVRASATLTSLAQGALAGDRDFTATSLDSLRANLRDLATAFPLAVTNAEVFTCPMHPDCVATDPAARCPKCGMALLLRRIPYSFVYTAPGEPTLQLTAASSAPLAVGEGAHVIIRLAHVDGSPVVLDELLVVHTEPIHLLIIDGTLVDYHHEHPRPTDTPGEYTFDFVPATAGPYRVFADLVPAATGIQEYPYTDLAAGIPFAVRLPEHAPTTESTVAGLTFRLAWITPNTAPPRANQPQALRIVVTDANGQPVTRLEPVMAAFAHLVGFYEDGRTVVHIHPSEAEVGDPAQRGGPALEFKFFPPKPGFLRLYCQVQVDGQAVFAPFSVNIAP